MTKTQNKFLLELLRKGRSVTRLTAMNYGVMNLTARITELRQRGFTIVCTMKRDGLGRKYGSFKLIQLPALASPAVIHRGKAPQYAS